MRGKLGIDTGGHGTKQSPGQTSGQVGGDRVRVSKTGEPVGEEGDDSLD
jgi:hypothetical protein